MCSLTVIVQRLDHVHVVVQDAVLRMHDWRAGDENVTESQVSPLKQRWCFRSQSQSTVGGAWQRREFVLCRVELDPSPDPVCFTCISMKHKVIYPSTAVSLSLKPVKQTLISFPGKVTCHIVQLLQSLVPRFYLYLGKALTPHTAPVSQPRAGGALLPLFDLAGLCAQTCPPSSEPVSVKSTSRVQLRLCPLKVKISNKVYLPYTSELAVCGWRWPSPDCMSVTGSLCVAARVRVHLAPVRMGLEQ